MKKFSANYSNSNHNFVIHNLKSNRIDSKYLPAICILKNILQRGKPTLLSEYLQENVGRIHEDANFNKVFPLISNEVPIWERLIRGDDKGNSFPAKHFFENLIPKYFDDYIFIQQLLIPEIPINEITQVEVDEFKNQQVDFYLPQAYLIIEIDGSQHELEKSKDELRDSYAKKYGIKTIRISTEDIGLENNIFLQKVQDIKKRIETVKEKQATRKKGNNAFISLYDYQLAYFSDVVLNSSFYKVTAIMRFQLLILELLENGLLNFQYEWNIELFNRDISDYEDIAIQDLMIWFKHIFKLQKIDFKVPILKISKVQSVEDFSNISNSIKVDFSLKCRYTDEFQVHPNVVFVRTDYLDEYLYFKKSNSRDKLRFHSFLDYDYFEISVTETILYNLTFGDENSDEESLLFLLWNIFLQNNNNLDFNNLNFREGQLPIITNALSKNDTIGLLPTGSGKSVCYQLCAILQPAISFVVCPIKALMYDQKSDLDLVFFGRTNLITSDFDSEDKELIQREFGSGKYLFIFISPERFQIKNFRDYFSEVNSRFKIAYAVVDEVHCLSEWGHDFRTSYLNLSKTINKYSNNFTWIGLTATASINVLKNIQIEFDIKQENIKTPLNYTREELNFIVINDNHNKFEAIKSQLKLINETYDISEEDESNNKCGIIFTPHVNGKYGCYTLSQDLGTFLRKDIKFYSGTKPKKFGVELVGKNIEFDEYRKLVQTGFKQNEFSLLVATKAFGMGVNKQNIYYTVHYGIPGSMESLYQEAGRAGRNKLLFKEKKATCLVLLSEAKNKILLNESWDKRTKLSKIKEIQSDIGGDVSTNLFLLTMSVEVISIEFDLIKKLLLYAIPNGRNIEVIGNKLDADKTQIEKAIYRLSQMGIVEDWTISNFFGSGVYEIDFSNYTQESIKKSLLKTINQYDKEFTFEVLLKDKAYSTYKKILLQPPENYTDIDKYIFILIQWSYDNFVYNRRQSLKNIYENCCAYAQGEISNQEFKNRLENYFRFTEKSYILQHISENSLDYLKWFDVFYQVDNNLISNKIINRKQQENLRDNLSRFLESYMNNTGLDLVSGMIRLMLDDYDNLDGRIRFESSLQKIVDFDESAIDFIINNIVNIGQYLNSKNKSVLARSLIEYFNTPSIILTISNVLGDPYSTSLFLEQINLKLLKINERVYEGFREVK